MKDNFRALTGAAIVAGCLGLISAVPAQAATLDCTVTAGVCTGGGATGITGLYSFAGALWSTTDTRATGTGVIDSFVRISDNADLVSGMNTSNRNPGAEGLNQDENSSPQFTRDLTAGQVPVVTITTNTGTATYYEFLLDINQTGTDPLLSLNAVELCVSETGNQFIGANDTDCAGTDLYSLGANRIDLNYNFNSGSGSGDLFMYIPTSALVDEASDFFYLWSAFGDPNNNNDGFEEWAVRLPTSGPPPTIPDGGATLTLLGLALGGIGAARRFMKS
jgi:hypothetical protein